MATILFVEQKSIYKTLSQDCYDLERNALNFPLNTPVVAHPPCRSWGRLRHLSKPAHGEKELGIWAVQVVRKCGGVLEHPISTGLIEAMNLPINGEKDQWGGFCLSVNQFWFGHKCEKKTLLYICGCELSEIPAYPLCMDAITHRIGGMRKINKRTGSYRMANKGLRELNRQRNSETPLAFATWLIQVADLCKPNPRAPQPFYNICTIDVR